MNESMSKGFRIERILIEGFKGFTTAQDIDLRNRHVFLLGSNGKGKSSIIEAIRWGLFGSPPGGKDVVRNGGYGGDCRVVIHLSRDGKAWRLTRVLIPGSGESRPKLVDGSGQEYRMGDILPQLDSLDAGEGAHVIFAPQSAPLGRPPQDLSPFERTVIGHLGLTDASGLSSHLETFLKGQEEEENRLTKLVDDRSAALSSQIADLERQRGRMLEAPPWDSELQPSIADTERKARGLIEEIAPAQSDLESVPLGLDALVGEAERVLSERVGLDRTPLDDDLERLDKKLISLEAINADLRNLYLKNKELRIAEEDLEGVLGGMSIDELRARKNAQQQSAKTLDLERRLGEAAAELMVRKGDQGSILCPVCGIENDRSELDRLISALVQTTSDEDSSNLRATEDQLARAQKADGYVWQLKEEIAECEHGINQAVRGSEDVKLDQAVRGGDVEDYIESVRQQRVSIQEQIDGFEDWLKAVKSKVQKLQDEAKFQRLQQDLSDLKAVNAEMQQVERSFEQFVQFGESVRYIQEAVVSTLIDELRKKVPSVAKELTTVFRALTKHDHFDRLVIDEEKLPKLELLVASSSDEYGTLHPTGVLNGQAESALALVPHFALSQTHDAPTEVYLVLLDDPTRAFDKAHIQILIEQLVNLGKRVQVVVATQETETFRELLPKAFERDTYVIIKTQAWSHTDGPTLAVE